MIHPDRPVRRGDVSWRTPHVTRRAALALYCILSLVTACAPEAADSAEHQDAVQPRAASANVELVIHHLDVGQADATLVQAPEATVLINAGHWLRDDLVPHLEDAGVESIDLVILIHHRCQAIKELAPRPRTR